VVVPPILQNAPRLNYPPLALRQRVEGTVEVRAFVDAQGVVTETQVLRGVAGKSGLNEAAVDNVRQRRYRPATRTGAPVGTWITVRVEFRLPR
jgi:periplasmic protein TonB